MDEIKNIVVGAARIIDRILFFPTFHDAEVMKILLERDNMAPSASVSLRLLVPKPDESAEAGDVEVEFRFLDVRDVKLENFNHQNVLSSITFVESAQPMMGSRAPAPRIEVDIDDIFGLWGSFTCARAEVIEVITSVYKAGAAPGS